MYQNYYLLIWNLANKPLIAQRQYNLGYISFAILVSFKLLIVQAVQLVKVNIN